MKYTLVFTKLQSRERDFYYVKNTNITLKTLKTDFKKCESVLTISKFTSKPKQNYL